MAENPKKEEKEEESSSIKTNEATIDAHEPECSDVENSMKSFDELMLKGNIALKSSDFPLASDLFSRALEIRAAYYGELAPECIHSYYKYGYALLNKAQEEADPFGAIPKKGAKSQQGSAKVVSVQNNIDGESSVASVSNNADKSEISIQRQGTDDVLDKSEKDKDVEGDTAEVEGEAEEEDLDLAWNMLDVARVISEKNSVETTEMVDILSALAEVSLEREEIETSLSDYQKALSIVERLVEPDSRRIVELNFRICLTLEIGSRAQEAIVYCQRAMSVCKSRMQRLTDELNSKSESNSTSAASEPEQSANHSSISAQSEKSISDLQAEIDTLNDISSDLEQKLEDLQQLESNPRSILSDILGVVTAKARANVQADASAGGSSRFAVATRNGDFGSPTISAHTNGTSEVTHLGVVGRGVKRMIMSAEASASKKPAINPKSDNVDNNDGVLE